MSLRKTLLVTLSLAISSPTLAQPCGLIDVEIRGASMSPLYESGDHINAMAPQCLGREIRRNDIVVFNSGASELPLIKRVVAVPGDRFTLKESHLRVNNTRLRNSTGEPFYFASGAEKLIALYENQFRGILPREVFFVLGDSDGVLDSARFGPVNLQDILYVGVSK